jgi:two-component system, chemotaxis family, CheB/CheR fusion protein
LRADETTGQVLTSLDIGLPMDTVRPLIGNAFVDPENPGETVVEAVNRRGRATQVRVTCTGFQAPEGNVNGALLLMDAQP